LCTVRPFAPVRPSLNDFEDVGVGIIIGESYLDRNGKPSRQERNYIGVTSQGRRCGREEMLIANGCATG